MNIFISLFFICAALLPASFAESTADERVETLWVTFKVQNGKDYQPAEEDAHKKIFATTLALIDKHNSNNSTYKMALNQFSDLSDGAKKAFLGLVLPPPQPSGRSAKILGALDRAVTSGTCNCDCKACCSTTIAPTTRPATTTRPTTRPATTTRPTTRPATTTRPTTRPATTTRPTTRPATTTKPVTTTRPATTTKPVTTLASTTKPGGSSFDIRNITGCNNTVKDQGQCGSCYVFSAIASLECAWALKHGGSISLSEQQSTSCYPYTSTNGCNGGWPSNVWLYLKNIGGAVSQAVLPYTSGNGVAGTCTVTATTPPKVAQVASYTNIVYGVAGNVSTIQNALVQYGTLSVAMNVVNSFYSYGSGIYSDSTCNPVPITVNHAVNIVGWGTSAGIDYWICRNSWGPNWALNGYFNMRRGVNMCFIETYVMAVVAV
jgi:C1A family cysteine protease